jgi:hypothetical protein
MEASREDASAWLRARALWVVVAMAGVGCGAATRPTVVNDDPVTQARTARRDVLRDVFLRGAPAAAGGTARVALTVEGLDACTAALLARGGSPGMAEASLKLTLFISASDVNAAAAAAPALVTQTVNAMRSAGHEVALRLDRAPLEGEADARAFRALLVQESEALRAALIAHGWTDAPAPRAWRGPPDRGLFDRSGFSDRPLVLWSVHPEDPQDTTPDAYLASVASGVRDADIVRWASGAGHCGLLEAAGTTARGLAMAGVVSATLSEVLGPFGQRRAGARLLRYGFESPQGLVPRWGRVLDTPDPETAIVAPLRVDGSLAERLASPQPWGELAAAAEPERVPRSRWLSPLASDRAVWVVGDGRPSRRDARALGPVSAPLVLPTIADLVRLEARQRLPWRLRGVVARALELLELQTPLLVDHRASVGVVVGALLSPEDLVRAPERLERAVAGFVQWSEASLSEYAVLAQERPDDRDVLLRAAYAFDGALRAGPFLVVGADGHAATTVDAGLLPGRGAPSFARPATALLADVLRSGASLAPGDVVVQAPVALTSAWVPPAPDHAAPPAGRAALRSALTRALLSGVEEGRWLRPGVPIDTAADTLGGMAYRLVLPAGVAVPNPSGLRDALPALDPRGHP